MFVNYGIVPCFGFLYFHEFRLQRCKALDCSKCNRKNGRCAFHSLDHIKSRRGFDWIQFWAGLSEDVKAEVIVSDSSIVYKESVVARPLACCIYLTIDKNNRYNYLQ